MKDPAVLFYFQDFLVGTEFMTDEEVGKYTRVLCHLADKGVLSKSQILRICKTNAIPEAINEKLLIDETGNYYQKRMREEREKRINYSESRRVNRTKINNKICKTHDKRMENENENENENINVIKKLNIEFAVFWNLYNKKEDRIKCERKWQNLTNTERSLCIARLPDYINSTPDKQFRKDPATYLNNKSWENEIIKAGNKVLVTLTYDEILTASKDDPNIWNKYDAVKRDGEKKAIFVPKK